MIRTQLDKPALHNLLRLGKDLHEESRYSGEKFDLVKVTRLFQATVDSPSKVFVAWDDEYRGFILMGIYENYFSDSKIASDFCLYIKPEHRGGLLVKRLVDKAVEWAKNNGANEIRLAHTTGIKSDTAVRLYNKLDFDLVGHIFKKEL